MKKCTKMDGKEYNEAFQRAKELHEAGNALTKQQMEIVFPQLAENECERIRRCIGMALTDVDEQRFKDFGTTLKDCLAYLEKQKELPFVKDVILGYPGLYFYDGERMHFQGNPAMEENQEKKKEPHYTKRNALFDKCVENCDPEVMKKVSDEIDAQLEKEQKPAEWSEEDEKDIAHIIRVLDDCYEYGKHDLSKTDHENLLGTLKSLRPQPHTVSIKDATKFGNLEYERGVKDGIQSEKSRHWKPSEEQMEALKRASINECPLPPKAEQ